MSDSVLPHLNASELRVLGALIEKSKTTPDYYPMSLNALTAACNQKTSRNPVVDYDEKTVMDALRSLKGQSLVATAVGAGSRTQKFKHNLNTVFDVSDAEITVLCLLMLRGPQTPGELNTNSGRMHAFSSLEEVYAVLEKMKNSSPPFVMELARQAGQKEARYTQLLCTTHEDAQVELSTTDGPGQNGIEQRMAALEKEVDELKNLISMLIDRMPG